MAGPLPERSIIMFGDGFWGRLIMSLECEIKNKSYIRAIVEVEPEMKRVHDLRVGSEINPLNGYAEVFIPKSFWFPLGKYPKETILVACNIRHQKAKLYEYLSGAIERMEWLENELEIKTSQVRRTQEELKTMSEGKLAYVKKDAEILKELKKVIAPYPGTPSDLFENQQPVGGKPQ